MCTRNPLHCIVPPKLLEQLLDHKDAEVRAAAFRTLLGTAKLRGQRELLAQTFAPPAAGGEHRSIFDAHHLSQPSGKLVRSEGGKEVADAAVNEAYDGLGATWTFYHDVFKRDSIDGKGLRLDGVVHFGHGYNNAFWNGARMVFGDGDGKAFIGFTKALDVVGHELTHGVTEFTCNLEYHDQPGALNESMSDVFGTLVKQHALKQTVDKADWLIGAGILGPAIKGKALRSMKEPGTAYDGDDQPSHMKHYQNLPNTDAGDYGGVHTNSGIPNKAFYLAATALGGHAWEAAGRIWYETLLALEPTSDFRACATTAYHVAAQLYGAKSREQDAVKHAWAEVGVRVDTHAPASTFALGMNASALESQLMSIAAQVKIAQELIAAT